MNKKYVYFFTIIIMMVIYFDLGISRVQIQAETVSATADLEQTTSIEENAVSLKTPSRFYGTSNNKKIQLKWKKNNNADGYILFKNGKKLKSIKNSKTSYVDKKVKLNKKYVYQILAYKKVNGKKIKSTKSYKISVIATNSKSKKLNAARFTNIKKLYKLGIGESKKLKPIVKFSKKVKGKTARKKKVYSKKIKWSSSNPKLVRVDKKGNITAASDKSTGTAKIYVRAHNGIRKVIKIKVVNYAKLGNIKNLKKIDDESIKKLITTEKDKTSIIAEYFEYNNPGKAIELSCARKQIETEDGGISYEWCVDMSTEIKLEKDMYDFILKYLLENNIKIIKVERKYIFFQNRHLYSFGYELNDLIYVFNGKNALDNYQYSNAVYDVMPVADRWYYGKSYAYGSIY